MSSCCPQNNCIFTYVKQTILKLKLMTSSLFQYFSTISTCEDHYITVQDAMTDTFMQSVQLHAWTKFTPSSFVIFLIYIIQFTRCGLWIFWGGVNLGWEPPEKSFWEGVESCLSHNLILTLILLTWTIWRAPTNASKWRMGFNSAFKVLIVTTLSLGTKYSIKYVFFILIKFL